MHDEETGSIIGKYLLHGEMWVSPYGSIDACGFSIIKINVQDNRTRIEVKPNPWQYESSGLNYL